MKLLQRMCKAVVQAMPEETVALAARRMREQRVGCLVVTDAGAVKGIITDRDLLACLAANHDPYQCAVSRHMRRPVIVLKPDEEVATAAEVMRTKRIKRLPIASDGQLIGIISLSDLAAIASDEADQLRPALDFFTAVVRAQSSQGEPLLATANLQQMSATEQWADSDRSDLIDVGGPG
jgi:CBS domain-containing protein